jgi:hypothetical protein
MISVGAIAARHSMPIWPRPPTSITTVRIPGPSAGIVFVTAWMAVGPPSASAAIEAGAATGRA